MMSSHRWAVVLLGMIVLVTYANSLGCGFVWDDVSSVQFNPYIQHIRYIPKLFVTDQHIAGRGEGNFYRPLVSLSFAADHAVWGVKNPFGYHLTNVFLHCGVVLCLYAFYVLVTGGSDRMVPTIAAALYAVLPAHTEAVAYISGRADMWVALFGLAALLALGKSRAAPHPGQWYAVSLCLLVGALLSKEQAVIFPLLILVTDIVVGLVPRGRTRWLYHLGSFGLVAAYVVLRLTVLWFASAAPPPTVGFVERLGITFQTLAMYAGILAWPAGLHMERSVGPLNGLLVLAGVMLASAATAGIVWSRRNDKTVLLGILWAAVALAPVSGIFPLNATLAEHWLYVPAMGVTLALAAGGVHVARRLKPASEPDSLSLSARRAVVSVACIMVVCMACVAIAQNRSWRDSETLFRHTLRYAPDSVRVHYNLGVLYDTQGKVLEAVREFSEAIRLDPVHLHARLDLAALAVQSGQREVARRYYREIIGMHPDDPESIEAYVNLGVLLYNEGQRDEPSRLWNTAMALAGNDPARRAFVQKAAGNTRNSPARDVSQ